MYIKDAENKEGDNQKEYKNNTIRKIRKKSRRSSRIIRKRENK
jgi:hypothetical protein